jgi:hypothetical protein
MSMEAEEERDYEEIMAELEGLVGERDFEAAQELIDDAEEEGWMIGELQAYLDEQMQK